MGVDWLVCNECMDTFPDCGPYVSCECGNHWCSDKCAEKNGYKYKEWEDKYGGWYESSCGHCGGEIEETVEITVSEYERLKSDSSKLNGFMKLNINSDQIDIVAYVDEITYTEIVERGNEQKLGLDEEIKGEGDILNLPKIT